MPSVWNNILKVHDYSKFGIVYIPQKKNYFKNPGPLIVLKKLF